MQYEQELGERGFFEWQEKANELARRFCPNENDRKLIDVETYEIHSKAWDSSRLEAAGMFGDWVEAEAFRKLAERFLMAMELIKMLEENADEIL